MTDVKSRTEDWKTLPWKHIQRNVFRLQQRIYQAVYCSILQCRTPRGLEACSQLTAAAAPLLVRPLPGGATGDAGESRQAHSRGGWYSIAETQTTAEVGQETEEPIELEGSPDSEEIHPQAGSR